MAFKLTGQFKWALLNQLGIYAAIQATLSLKLFELFENGYDAGARDILFRISPDKWVISDNGHGMTPEILPEDVIKLERFWQEIENGTIEPGFEVREVLSPGSKASLEWLELCIAFSPKKIEQLGTKKGILGIGFQGVRSLRNDESATSSIVVTTRPSRELAVEYWEKDSEWAQNPPVFRLKLRSKSEISKYIIEPDVEIIDEVLRDALGDELKSGTVITISELRPGLETSFRLEQFIEQCQARFGSDIENGLKLRIYDDRSKTGKLYQVPPAEYKGYPIVDRVLFVKCQDGSRAQCRARFWYDPNGRNLKVKIKRGTSTVCSLDELERRELNSYPLSSGKVTGDIEYPVIRGEMWDANKRIPPAGVTLNHWVDAVESMIPEINRRIKEIDDLANEELSRKSAKEISRAASKVLDDMGLLKFKGDRGRKTSTGKTRKPQSPPAELDQILVIIEDENKQGVGNVEVTVARTDKEEVLGKKRTSTTGWINFGHYGQVYEDGSYRVMVNLPEGVEFAEGEINIRKFGIGKRYNQIGYRAVFAVISGAPKRTVHPIRSLSVISKVLSDPKRAYDPTTLDAGVLLINSGHEIYKTAYESGDMATIDAFSANCVGAAISELAFAEFSREDQLHQAVVISTKTLSALPEFRRTGSRRV